MKRRELIKGLALLGAGGAFFKSAGKAGAAGMVKPWEWVEKQGEITNTDGTPLQFMPKGTPDPNPLENEFAKYPRCPYCGMGRKMWHHSRHLIHYADDLADGTCSLHCAALSLSLNLDRGPKAIYAADFGASDKTKPLVEVKNVVYLISSGLKGTMTAHSKMAFSSRAAAEGAMAKHGGKLGGFYDALTAAHLDMATDTMMIRKRRDEKRRHKNKKKSG